MTRFILRLTVTMLLASRLNLSYVAKYLKRFPGKTWQIITSRWGPRWGTIHRGEDWGSPNPAVLQITGAPVFAPLDGVVTNGNEPRGAGLWLWVAWGPVLFKSFHLMRQLVPNGTFVVAGTLIGYSDNTGSSTGAHNHWELWINGVNIDPHDELQAALAIEKAIEAGHPPTTTPPPATPTEEIDMAAEANIIANTNTRIKELRDALGVTELLSTTFIVNKLDDESKQIQGNLQSAVGFAGWASRPYLVGIHGEPAIYKKVDGGPGVGEYLVWVRNPSMKPTDPADVKVAKNLAWLEYTIESGHNPEIQWYYPNPTDEQKVNGHANDALIVEGLRLLPGYVPIDQQG